MGVLEFAEADLDHEMANDEEAAEELDRVGLAHIKSVVDQA